MEKDTKVIGKVTGKEVKETKGGTMEEVKTVDELIGATDANTKPMQEVEFIEPDFLTDLECETVYNCITDCGINNVFDVTEDKRISAPVSFTNNDVLGVLVFWAYRLNKNIMKNIQIIPLSEKEIIFVFPDIAGVNLSVVNKSKGYLNIKFSPGVYKVNFNEFSVVVISEGDEIKGHKIKRDNNLHKLDLSKLIA